MSAEPRCASIESRGSVPDDELQHWLDSAFIDNDIDACAARWHAGENIAWPMAVSALF